MKRLTQRDIQLLKAASEHSISDSRGEYYQLIGNGHLLIRYNPRTIPNLCKQGYIRYDGGWKTTDVGKAYLKEISAEVE